MLTRSYWDRLRVVAVSVHVVDVPVIVQVAPAVPPFRLTVKVALPPL